MEAFNGFVGAYLVNVVVVMVVINAGIRRTMAFRVGGLVCLGVGASYSRVCVILLFSVVFCGLIMSTTGLMTCILPLCFIRLFLAFVARVLMRDQVNASEVGDVYRDISVPMVNLSAFFRSLNAAKLFKGGT